MKIIGEIPGFTKQFILEATEDELSHLCGYYYHGEKGCPSFKVGMKVNVHEMYNQLYRLKSAQREVENASKTLHSIANLALIINPIIEEVIKEEENTK
jgi:hypothetical protein